MWLLVLLMTATVAVADDKRLLAEMELELKIQEISAEAYSFAKKKVEQIALQTGLGRAYREQQKKLRAYMDKNCEPVRLSARNHPPETQYSALCQKLVHRGIRRHSRELQRWANAGAEGPPPTMDEPSSYKEASRLAALLTQLKERFVWQVYLQELRKRLAKLSLNIGQKRAKDLYKQHSA